MRGTCLKCNVRLITTSDNVVYFKKRCPICKVTYKQKKRRPRDNN